MDWSTLLNEAGHQEISGTLHRIVESQEQVATNSLVDSLEEQALLEEMLDETKPAVPADAQHLHYLLSTPFRYPPLPWGSRFGSRNEPSLFYGSKSIETMLCEKAFYQLSFRLGMNPPPDERATTQHTVFEAQYASEKGVRLHQPPFDQYLSILADPVDYRETQAFGSIMREDGVEVIEFTSARDPELGINVALYTATALASARSSNKSSWLCETTNDYVAFSNELDRSRYQFGIEEFLVDGVLPNPTN